MVKPSLTEIKESQHCYVNTGTRTYRMVIGSVPTVGRRINTIIYATCGKIGGSKPQLRQTDRAYYYNCDS